MSGYYFDGVIFDLDGVITHTASVHSAAWKQMFDEFLMKRAQQGGAPFREFTHANDYLPYVDGKSRYEGVASFLRSRGIELEFGHPSDPSDRETICGLGNRKNDLFNVMIAHGEVEVFSSSIHLLKELKANSIQVGVASSSKNAKTILDVVGITDLFDVVVDGVVSADRHLKGKPAPDIFTTACDDLGIPSDRAVIVEDAVSGVQAGMNGNFGLVVGVAREGNQLELLLNGADVVVQDLAEIDLARLEDWFTQGLNESQWTLTYLDYQTADEGLREVLCTVGNGYLGTRGAMEESQANGINYPGTYIAGVYNRLESTVAGRTVVNEDFVNCPNWLPITFQVDGDGWMDINKVEMVEFIRQLDFRTGVLSRRMVVRDGAGRETLIESRRVASMAQPHLVALRYCITPLNYSGVVTVRSGLDGDIINAGVERYRQLSSKHLEPVEEGGQGNTSYLLVQTNQSKVQIVEVAKHFFYVEGKQVVPEMSKETKPGAVYSFFTLEARKGQNLQIDKVVAITTSRDRDVDNDPITEASETLEGIVGFDPICRESIYAWMDIWKKLEIQVEGDRLAQKLLRFNLYHSMVTASPHNAYIDAGIPARGLHGEAYRGHIFWDEMYILPLYDLHFPETARSVLLYRYRRLDQARAYAREHGYEGATFPWQSGSDGREETQVIHLNPLSGEWGPDHSSLQRHVSLAIAMNVWQYCWITGDVKFLEKYGAEMFLEICRFWASKARLCEGTNRYEIAKVMGPDEFHEKYAGASEGGLKDNSYTNIMVAWVLSRALDILGWLDENPHEKKNLLKRINLGDKELTRWKDIIRRIHIPLSEDGVLEQFEGYFDLQELDWEGYLREHQQISRMDRILKAEGKTPDEYKVAKQADALMAFYNLGVGGVKKVLSEAGYSPPADLLERNFRYYYPRTSHGSTLSKLVHSYLANRVGDERLSMQLYGEALKSDYADVQVGTTREGIHVGVMAGSAVLALRSYAGLDLSGEQVRIDPRLPGTWRKAGFNVDFRGARYFFEVTSKQVKIRVESKTQDEVGLLVREQRWGIPPGQWVRIDL
ncbi:MAG: beta-phosphoglucomutase family hydrolase [Chloroflexota bacterium]